MSTNTQMPAVATMFGVVELRRYVMQPGRRDDLIEMFEDRFIDAQEACGTVPIGHYRDLDDADAFVWFRGFERMETRRAALEAFYTSPTWTANRNAANATLIDSDDVLLLRSARPESGFDVRDSDRPVAMKLSAGSTPLVAVSIFMLDGPAGEPFVAAFEDALLPRLREHAERITYLVTEDHSNDYPRLPVREGEYALVVTGACGSAGAVDAWAASFGAARLPEPLRSRILTTETLRLEPCARSLYP